MATAKVEFQPVYCHEARIQYRFQPKFYHPIVTFNGWAAPPIESPLWVKSRPFATIPRMSAFGGKADIGKPACREPHSSPPAIARSNKARIRPMRQQKRVVLIYVPAFLHM